jgi:hypothetical protein
MKGGSYKCSALLTAFPVGWFRLGVVVLCAFGSFVMLSRLGGLSVLLVQVVLRFVSFASPLWSFSVVMEGGASLCPYHLEVTHCHELHLK